MEFIETALDQANTSLSLGPLASSIGVESRASSSSSFDDHHRSYFTTFSREIELVVALEAMVARGREHVHTLYTYRSVSQAIPEIAIDKHDADRTKSNLEAESTSRHSLASTTSFLTEDTDLAPHERAELAGKKDEINAKIAEVLRKEMTKVKDLFFFVQDAIALLSNAVVIATKAHKEMDTPPSLLRACLALLDTLTILDTLKECKPCLQKDFSRYKRVLGGRPSIEILEELQLLQSFLAGQDARKARYFILTSLRDSVKRVGDHETFLFDCLDLALRSLEEVLYVLPEEKFSLLRALPVLLYLLDGERDDSSRTHNVFRQSRLPTALLQKYLKRFPVVPLFADVSMSLVVMLQRVPHFDISISSSWGLSGDRSREKDKEGVPSEYDLSTRWFTIRDSYLQSSSRLAALSLRLQRQRQRLSKPAESEVMVLSEQDALLCHDVYEAVQEALQKSAAWLTLLQLFLSWKYTHPGPAPNSLEGMTEEGAEYARVLRDNLSTTELFAMVDVISMIKTLAAQLVRAEATLSPYVHRYVHHRVQRLVQAELTPLLHRLDKRNKPSLPLLLQVRSIAADWLEGESAAQDYKEYSRRRGDATSIPVRHAARCVAPTLTQLTILRMQLAALCASHSEMRRKASLFGKADLEKSDILLFENFLTESFSFPHTLFFAEHCAALSSEIGASLWNREFFLEMSRCVQFPIELSLPWLCIDLLLKHARSHPVFLEKLPVMLDLYNDAAQAALHRFQVQWLYDEVEAEANLAVDQCFFLLCEEVYAAGKERAATETLDAALRLRLEEMKGKEVFSASLQHFEALLSQKALPLLGRSIDLSLFCAQSINAKLRRDVDVAIRRFESGPVSGIADLAALLRLLRATHSELSRFLEIDDFDMLVLEVDESISPVAYRGRVSLHLLQALARDLLSNWLYNGFTGRFVRSAVAVRPVEFARPPKQAAIAQAFGSAYKAFEATGRLQRDFFGAPHFALLSAGSTLCDCIPLHWNMILDQLAKNLLDKIVDISEYFEALQDGIPPCKPPAAVFGSIGAFGFYESQLRPLLHYDDLQPEVFQTLREIGNSVALFKELSAALETRHLMDFIQLRPLFLVSGQGAQQNKDKSENFDEVAQRSPLLRITTQTQQELLRNRALRSVLCRSEDVLQRVPPLLHRAMESRFHSTIAPEGGRSLLRWLLLQVEEFLYQQSLTTDWAAFEEADSQRGPYFALDVERSRGFVKLWSTLSFLFCINEEEDVAVEEDSSTPEEQSEREITNAAEFGHGFAIAGCLFLHLLAQRPMFELLDFSTHVLRLSEHERVMGVSLDEQRSEKVDPLLVSETKKFIAQAAFQQRLYIQWIAFFENIHQIRPSYVKLATNKTSFHPPAPN